MLVRVGELAVRRRKWVLVATAVAFVVAGAVGGGVADHLSSGGFEDPDAESTKAAEVLAREFGAGDPDFIIVVTATGGRDVDDPAVAVEGADLAGRLAAEEGVGQVISYWGLGQAPPFRSTDGRQALILATLEGDEDQRDETAERLIPSYTVTEGPIRTGIGGFTPVFNEVSETIEKDLARAEAVAIPITLVLLVLVFGSVVAASLPLAIGGLAIIGTFLVLRIVAELTQVSIFSLNMTTAMGLGLAIDYSLFIVSRFREELARGLEPHAAVVRTVDTAGRTVLFSAMTVAASLAALLIFPFAFLRSFAYAGIPVVSLAALGSILTLPALLAVVGRNVDRWALLRRPARPSGDGRWHRIAVAVMRRPLPIATAVVMLLLLLGAPALGMELGLPDDRVQSESATTRQVHDEIRERFGTQEAGAASVVGTGLGDATAHADAITSYAAELSTVDGVGRVDAPTGSFVEGALAAPPSPAAAGFVSADRDTVLLRVVPEVEPMSPEGEAMVKAVRDVDAPFEVLVGGMSAELVDAKSSLFGDFPLAAALIGIVTFVVLFLMFGSIVVPIKAIVLNLLSLTATFGAMVWIFQDGHLSGVLDFTARGTLDLTAPILMFCIAFGLSMDYEVFLLSRVKEEYDVSGDNETAVAAGLERTGRIVTAAAALIAVVFLAMVSSSIAFIKLFGLGLALAVIADATLVRATLVPAFMKMAGRANWWAPAPLRRIHERWGFSEAGAADPVPVIDLTTAESIDLVDAGASDAPAPHDGASLGHHGAERRRRERPLVAPGRPGREIRVVREKERSSR